MNYKFQVSKDFPQNMNLFFALYIWFLFWALNDAVFLKYDILSYQLGAKDFFEQLRAYNCSYDVDTQDYYAIIKFCDKIIPPSENLRLILPSEDLNKNAFLVAKGRYYLYPRNYGNNEKTANYILVYSVQNYQIPENYKKIWTFSENSFLLAKNIIVNPRNLSN